MTEDKDISTSEIIGELRKGARTFKIFEKALAIAENIADHKKQVTVLTKEIKVLSSERDALDSICDELVSKSNDAEKRFKELDSAIQKRLEQAEKEGNVLIDSARKEAASIVASAKAESNKIKQGIKSLQKTAQAARQAKDAAEDEYLQVKNKVQKIKSSLIQELSL